MNYLNRYIPKKDILWPHRIYQDIDGTWNVFHELLGYPTMFGTHKTEEAAREHAAKLNEHAWAKSGGSRLACDRAQTRPLRKWALSALFRPLRS